MQCMRVVGLFSFLRLARVKQTKVKLQSNNVGDG